MAEQKTPVPARHRRPVTSTEREDRIASAAAQRMVATTADLIAQRGIAAANVREIAAACRVSAATPLWYFGSKGRLLIEVLHRQRDARLEFLLSCIADATSRDELVEGLHRTVLAFLEQRSHRGDYELITEINRLAIDDQDVATRRGELRREYRDVLARCLGDKERAGVVSLAGHSTSVAGLVISVTQGLAAEIAGDRGWKFEEALADARLVIEALLQKPPEGTRVG